MVRDIWFKKTGHIVQDIIVKQCSAQMPFWYDCYLIGLLEEKSRMANEGSNSDKKLLRISTQLEGKANPKFLFKIQATNLTPKLKNNGGQARTMKNKKAQKINKT